MSIYAPPSPRLDLAERAWRQALRYALGLFMVAVLAAVAYAYMHAALTNQPVQDMSGGLTALILGLVPLVIEQINRSRERMAMPGPPRSFTQPAPEQADPARATEPQWSGHGPNGHGGPTA